MTEEVWFTLTRPHRMLTQIAERASERRLRLLGAAYHRWRGGCELDNVLAAAVRAVEQFADGIGTDADIEAVEEMVRLRLRWWDSGPSRAVTVETMHLALELSGRTVRAAQNEAERLKQCALIRDIFGNPFRPVTFAPEWRTDTAVAIASQMYESRDFSAMPILADALQDAGCDSDDILSHCRQEGLPSRPLSLAKPGERDSGAHVRGCWVVDLVLGKE